MKKSNSTFDKKEKYMDRFMNALEFVQFEILSNRGIKNIINKSKLRDMCEKHGVDLDSEKIIEKKVLLELLIAKIGLEQVIILCGVGVSSYSFQLKFGITNDDIKYLAKQGFIKVTGCESFKVYGTHCIKHCIADLYSPLDYYNITQEYVLECLSHKPIEIKEMEGNHEEKYMDKFKNALEFVQFKILSNRGNENGINNAELTDICEKNGVDLDSNTFIEKEILLELLIEKVGLEQTLILCGVGVSSYNFQIKFDITNSDVKYLAKHGFIKVTGHESFKLYGKYRIADLYSPLDYYNITQEYVHECLSHRKKRGRK